MIVSSYHLCCYLFLGFEYNYSIPSSDKIENYQSLNLCYPTQPFVSVDNINRKGNPENFELEILVSYVLSFRFPNGEELALVKFCLPKLQVRIKTAALGNKDCNNMQHEKI